MQESATKNCWRIRMRSYFASSLFQSQSRPTDRLGSDSSDPPVPHATRSLSLCILQRSAAHTHTHTRIHAPSFSLSFAVSIQSHDCMINSPTRRNATRHEDGRVRRWPSTRHASTIACRLVDMSSADVQRASTAPCDRRPPRQ